jgi:hypothetical protein
MPEYSEHEPSRSVVFQAAPPVRADAPRPLSRLTGGAVSVVFAFTAFGVLVVGGDAFWTAFEPPSRASTPVWVNPPEAGGQRTQVVEDRPSTPARQQPVAGTFLHASAHSGSDGSGDGSRGPGSESGVSSTSGPSSGPGPGPSSAPGPGPESGEASSTASTSGPDSGDHASAPNSGPDAGEDLGANSGPDSGSGHDSSGSNSGSGSGGGHSGSGH